MFCAVSHRQPLRVRIHDDTASTESGLEPAESETLNPREHHLYQLHDDDSVYRTSMCVLASPFVSASNAAHNCRAVQSAVRRGEC